MATCLQFLIIMKTIVLILVGFTLVGGRRQVLAGDRCIGTNAWLIIVTCVMHVVMVRLVLTFFVVGLTLVLVLGVLVALLGGVLVLWSVRRAWLDHLVATIKRGLVFLFLLTLIIVATTTAVITILPLSRGNSTYCLTFCGNCHLHDVIPRHRGPSCCTACVACDASCISCIAQFCVCVSLLASHLLLAS